MTEKRVKSVDLKSSGWRHVTFDDGSKELQPPTGARVAGSGEPAPEPRGKKTEKKGPASKKPKGLSKVEASLAEKPKSKRPVVTATLEATADADKPRGVANPPSRRKAPLPKASTGNPASDRTEAKSPKKRRVNKTEHTVDRAAENYDKSILEARAAAGAVTAGHARVESARRSGDSDTLSNAQQGLVAAREESRRATGTMNRRATGSQPVATDAEDAPSREFSGKNVVTGRVMTGERNPQVRGDDREFESTNVKNLLMHLGSFKKHAEAHRGGDAKARGKMNAARIAYHNSANEHGQMPGHPDRPNPNTDAPCFTPDCPNTAPITSDGVCPSCDAQGL